MRSNLVVGLVAAGFILVVSNAIVGAGPGGGPGDDESRSKIGLDYAKDQGIPLNFKGRNRAQVGLGSYLVNAAGGCNDCHTAPPYTSDPYAFLGAPKQINVPCYLAGGQEFGPFVSRDITPWEDHKPAGLSQNEFIHVLRTGEDPDNPGQVLQVMPWPVYQALSDNDLKAIYQYLTAIPAIDANTCGTPSEP